MTTPKKQQDRWARNKQPTAPGQATLAREHTVHTTLPKATLGLLQNTRTPRNSRTRVAEMP